MLLAALTLLALFAMAPLQDQGAVTRGTTSSGRHAVVALGDSVPSGAACGCVPFPEVYGTLLSQRTGTSVTVSNDAVSELDTTGLLAQFQQTSLTDQVRRADVVLVTIGANDFLDHHDDVLQGSCGTTPTSDCLSDELASMRSHLTSVLAEVGALRHGEPTSVLVTGYWNVFEDGQVAQKAAGLSGLAASIQLTRTVNTAIESVATAAGAQYVDLYRPFQDRSGTDIDSLLSPDGDHPNAAGHRLIASTLLDAGLPHLP